MSKKVFILDLDGTLYYQFPVRVMMALELLFYYLFHPKSIRDLKLLLAYRKAHDQVAFDLDCFSKSHSFSPQRVQEIVQYWLIERPLKWISLFSDKKLLNLLKDERTIIFSDYPTPRKMKAIHFTPEGQFFYGDGNIQFMKPHSQGLLYIKTKYHLNKEDMIFIGDRLEKDGLCAKNFGCRYIILKSIPFFRWRQYKKIKDEIKN